MQFSKIQATGNDFIIIDNIKYSLSNDKLSSLAKVICKRKLSIGADGLIAVDKSYNADIKMIFFNSDGSTAEMCGNGSRCIARYAYENKLAPECMSIETTAGIVYAYRQNKRCYKIKLNNPMNITLYGEITIDGVDYQYSYMELGNPGIPHVLIRYKDIKDADTERIYTLAKKIRYNNLFSKGTNVSLYDIMNDVVYVKTYERGVEDFTLACGTGVAATAITTLLKNEINKNTIVVITNGGELTVTIDSSLSKSMDKAIDYIVSNVYLIGDTNIIAVGEIIDENL